MSVLNSKKSKIILNETENCMQHARLIRSGKKTGKGKMLFVCGIESYISPGLSSYCLNGRICFYNRATTHQFFIRNKNWFLSLFLFLREYRLYFVVIFRFMDKQLDLDVVFTKCWIYMYMRFLLDRLSQVLSNFQQ